MYEGILGIFVKMSLNLIHYLSFKLLKEKIVFSFPILKLLNKKIKKKFKIIFFILFIFFPPKRSVKLQRNFNLCVNT